MNRSNIPYLTHTWNPTTGCSPVSAGCSGCWAAAYHRRWRKDFTPTTHPEKLDEPLRLRKPSVIGVSFMGDLFHDEIPDDFVSAVFGVMAASPRHTFIVLTKRPERMRSVLSDDHEYTKLAEEFCVAHEEGDPLFRALNRGWFQSMPLPNVYLGVSVEDQATADERIPILLDTPAAHRWVSIEPQVGPGDLSRWLRVSWQCSGCGGYFGGKWQKVCPQCGREDYWCGSHKFNGHDGPFPSQSGRAIDLVITGAESGVRRRRFDPAWAKTTRDQCRESGTNWYYKQAPGPDGKINEHPTIDGVEHRGLPWTA